MKSQINSSQPDTLGDLLLIDGPRISGFLKKTVIGLWGFITILSLFSFIFSVYSLNLWDRLSAAELPRYFSDMTPETVQFLAEWKNTILQTGLSLSGYALIFTVSRVICAVTLFIVGFMLIRRYSDHLMAVLMAILLSVFAAAGMWNNPLFSWGVALAPWLNYPVQFLAWLTWCGAIVIYTFPDGKFAPRWTLWLAVLLVPLTFLMAFNVDILLNPNNWPEPFYLLPNILFTGAALFSIIYRHQNTLNVAQKRSLQLYEGGISLLIVLYFIHLFMMNIYPLLTGHVLFEGNEARLNYVLLSEPIWFASETFFAIGLALSVFRDNLMERSAR
ncbi:MAG TPA: hypothetical protein VMN99_12450 [Anaerolineales bacterium]|nr:hypothetical protein [Anaerolineales bacterium]